MEEAGAAGPGHKFTVKIVGFEPGCSQEAVVKVLGRLYKNKEPEEIRRALARLPLTLTRNATEEQARKIRKLLEEIGIILEISFTGIAKPKALEEKAGPDATGRDGAKEKEAVLFTRPVSWVKDRRSRPRVHPGVELEPMSIWDMIKGSLVLLKENLSLFFVILLIPSGLSYIISKALEAVGPDRPWESIGGLVLWALVSIIGALVVLVMFLWAEGAMIFAVSEVCLGHEIGVLDCYRGIGKRLADLIFTMVLVWVLIALGTLVFVIPGMVLFFRWLLVDKVVVIEGLRGKEARERSRELMRPALGSSYSQRPWFRAGMVLGVAFLVALGGILLLVGPAWIISLFLPQIAGLHLKEAMGLVTEVLVTAFLSILMVLYYYDLRIRKEGLDHRGLAQNLGL